MAVRAHKSEKDPLDPEPPSDARRTLAAIRHLETAILEAGGTALRYGSLYGPGTSLGTGGVHVEAVRRRRFPIVGAGTGVWSFAHIDDVATATLAAIDLGVSGIFNVVDEDPAPVSEWLPVLAQALGAKPPRRVPVWLARLAAGEMGVVLMTEIRGASNAKAKTELGWRPRWESWRRGFVDGLG